MPSPLSCFLRGRTSHRRGNQFPAVLEGMAAVVVLPWDPCPHHVQLWPGLWSLVPKGASVGTRAAVPRSTFPGQVVQWLPTPPPGGRALRCLGGLSSLDLSVTGERDTGVQPLPRPGSPSFLDLRNLNTSLDRCRPGWLDLHAPQACRKGDPWGGEAGPPPASSLLRQPLLRAPSASHTKSPPCMRSQLPPRSFGSEGQTQPRDL